MKGLLCLVASCVLAASELAAQVVLSEVMYNPAGSEQANEFVELYNTSASDSISLAGWQVGDQNELDEIITRESGLILPPQAFAVILDPTYFQSSTQYDSLIPSNALILTIADATFGSGGFLNSTAETVILVDADGDTVARYTYSLGNPDGISDEKIVLNPDDSAQNWTNSLQVNGTPGTINITSPRLVDGELVPLSLRISPYPLREGMTATISILLRNNGIVSISDYSVNFDLVPINQTFGAPLYLGSAEASQALFVGDTLRLQLSANELRAGRYRLVASLVITGDGNARNDTLSTPLDVGWRRETIVINEIMFEPASGQPEWIEIFNPQAFSVPLFDWVVEDEAGGQGRAREVVFIPPRSYRVLTASAELASLYQLADSAIILLTRLPALNNSGDLVLLRDFSNTLIDSVFYDREWGQPGKAIEKIWYERGNSRRNWLPSRAKAGATPAAFNSVSPRDHDLEIGPLRFTPNRPEFGETIQIETWVHNRGRLSMIHFAVDFFYQRKDTPDSNATISLATVQVETGLSSEDSTLVNVSWVNAPSGKNLVTAQSENDFDEVSQNDRTTLEISVSHPAKTLVINEVMFEPVSGQPDWIEIFNPQTFPVFLRDWTVSDEVGSRGLVDQIIPIPPKGFRVLTSSQELATLYGLADTAVIVTKSFPALNANGDVVSLRDFSGFVIDSLAYGPDWGMAGKSIEKIRHERANDRSNWAPSQAPVGATPAAFNSVSPRDIDLAVTAVRFEPVRPRFGETVRIEAVIQNQGRSSRSNFEVALFAAKRQAPLLELGRFRVVQELPSEDSVLVTMNWEQPPSGWHDLIAQVYDGNDFVIANDRFQARLPVGYLERSLVINEIYYSPAHDEPEWFEIFNRSNQPVEIYGWLWRDASAVPSIIFAEVDAMLPPQSYAVVSAAGEIPLLDDQALALRVNTLTLNNDEETLVLRDFSGGKQDSIRFAGIWGGARGFSLERINPDLATQDSSNWSTCVDLRGATPGRQNSIFTSLLSSSASVAISPNVFSPDDDGHDDFAIIQLNLPVTTAAVHLKIFDLRGRLVRHLLNNRPVGSKFEVVWNGRDDDDQRVRTGVYVVYVQAVRADQGALLSTRTTVVVARPLN